MSADDFSSIIAESTPEIQTIARACKQLILDVMPDVVEVVWTRQRIAGYGIGPKKMSEQFCYLAPYKKHINFGFYYGADLADPANLLKGSGEMMRHVKIKQVEQLEDPSLKQLVEVASTYFPNLDT